MKNRQGIILIGAVAEVMEVCDELDLKIERVVEDDEAFFKHSANYHNTPIHIVPDKGLTRKKLWDVYRKEGFSLETLISTHAYVSQN